MNAIKLTAALALLASAAFADDVSWVRSGEMRIGASTATSVSSITGNNVHTDKNLTVWISATTYLPTNLVLTGLNGVTLETRSIGAVSTPVSVTFVAPLRFTGVKISPTASVTETAHYQLIQAK